MRALRAPQQEGASGRAEGLGEEHFHEVCSDCGAASQGISRRGDVLGLKCGEFVGRYRAFIHRDRL